jgi:multiple sugar transport system permease protein
MTLATPSVTSVQAEAQARAIRARRWKQTKIALNYALMIALAAFFVFPIIIMVISSTKPENLVSSDMTTIFAFIPRQANAENYTCRPFGQLVTDSIQGVDFQDSAQQCVDAGREPGVFERLPMPQLFVNSLFVTISIVAGGLFVNSMAAYALARLRWPGRSLALAVIIALIIVPFESIAVPLLLLVNQLPWFDRIGWTNSYHVQIIPFLADAFSIFLFYQFFIGIPKDLDEAARVDGAGGFRIYWQIVVPLSRPVFATVAILQFLGFWGSFLWPLMTTQGFDYTTLPVAMKIFFGQAPRQWGDIMAFASLVTVPVLIVFLMFQRWFIQSVSSSGVKG